MNVRRGKYEGTTRVSEREKREKEGLIFKRDIQKRGRDILLHRKTAPTEKEKKKEKNLSFLPQQVHHNSKREDTQILFFAFSMTTTAMTTSSFSCGGGVLPATKTVKF